MDADYNSDRGLFLPVTSAESGPHTEKQVNLGESMAIDLEMKILIADDMSFMRSTVKSMLKELDAFCNAIAQADGQRHEIRNVFFPSRW